VLAVISHCSARLWLYALPSVDFTLHAFGKSDTSPDIFKSKFLDLCENLHDYLQMYTDGSEANDKVDAAAVGQDIISSITNQASIFMAELVSLNLLLSIIRRSKHKKFVIFSDSLSNLLDIRNIHLETGYILKFIKEYAHLVNS